MQKKILMNIFFHDRLDAIKYAEFLIDKYGMMIKLAGE